MDLTREQCVTQIDLLEQQKRGIEMAMAELRADLHIALSEAFRPGRRAFSQIRATPALT